jgi:hypothetical protein
MYECVYNGLNAEVAWYVVQRTYNFTEDVLLESSYISSS